jgi:hypothetical protein
VSLDITCASCMTAINASNVGVQEFSIIGVGRAEKYGCHNYGRSFFFPRGKGRCVCECVCVRSRA